MTSLLEPLDALEADVAAGAGADRALDARFAELVLGWREVRLVPFFLYYEGTRDVSDTPTTGPIRDYTHPEAGHGALFAAARALWPGEALRVEVWQSNAGPQALAMFESRREERHPDLCRALMGAMIAAKRAEIAGGGK